MLKWNRAPLAALLLLGPLALPGQVAAPPAFSVADIHTSPHHAYPYWTGGILRGDRFTLKQATMVDLIVNAYDVKADDVQGGPPWLEMDRFDIIAKAPPETPPASVRLMLQSLLVDRFGLKVHNGNKALPTFVLTAHPGRSSLKEADPSAASGCHNTAQPSSPSVILSCRNITMEAFARSLHSAAYGDINQPVVDATTWKGAYDFDLHWTPVYALQRAGAENLTVFSALDQQLGLKLTLRPAERPVLLVDSVNDHPTPNIVGIEKVLPPAPPAQFEVAVVKPSKPGTTEANGNITGDQVKVTGMTAKTLIYWGWNLNESDDEVLLGAPRWLDTDRFDVLARIPAEVLGSAGRRAQQLDEDDLKSMMQQMLAERFNLKTHIESHPVTAYSLTAVSPKLTPADPASRTRCIEGPGPDGKDPRLTSKVLNRLIYCQNMTSAQIGEELQHIASGYIYGPVVDETNLKGSWNFTLSFSSIDVLHAAETSGANSTAGTASDPSAALSLFDAVRRELGLKLEKEKRPAPVLVIDHIDEKSTEN